MLSDWELWACAQQQLAQHGDDAAFQAAIRADELLSVGDMAGHRNWVAICERIAELNRTASDDTRH